MSHKKKGERWQHNFRLTSEDPEEAKLHKLLLSLGETGGASEWIVLACLHYQDEMDYVTETAKRPVVFQGIDAFIRPQKTPGPEPHYEPAEEVPSLTPSEIIQQRKANARAKYSRK